MLLFVAGAPDPGDTRPPTFTGFQRVLSLVVPPLLLENVNTQTEHPQYVGDSKDRVITSLFPPHATELTRSYPPLPVGAWHLPGDMMMALEVAQHETERLHLPLQVIDVNNVADRTLVDRYVGVGDVLPMLVRSDGTRLEGFESFEARKVRRFLGRH